MRIGALHVTWRTAQKKRDEQVAIRDYLRHDQAPRAVIARIARSEVKNALATITMTNTIAVVTKVSLRVGHVTLRVSDRTS